MPPSGSICFFRNFLHQNGVSLIFIVATLKRFISKIIEKFSCRTGFEPVRGDPNGFLVHRLNRSAIDTQHTEISVTSLMLT